MQKKITNFILSIFTALTVLSLATPVSALTLEDIYFLLNNDIINPTQASILMKNTYMFGGVTPAKEVTPVNTPAEIVKTCIAINSNLKLEDKDSTLNGNAVTILQKFLNRDGYLKVTPTGYFGNLTLSAVKTFQTVNDLVVTGEIDTVTRERIKELECNNIEVSSTSISTNPANPPIANKPDSLPPTITIKTIPEKAILDEYVTLTWTANNAIGNCNLNATDTLGGTLKATVAFDGASQVGPIKAPTTYTIVCYNKYGIPATNSTTVNIMSTSTTVSMEQYLTSGRISSITPDTGNRGDIVTINGSGFLESNDIFFGGFKVDKNLITSQSATAISFKIPEYKTCTVEYCPMYTLDTRIDTGGKKVVQVYNKNGYSNDIYFTLPNNVIVIPGTNIVPTMYSAKLELLSVDPISGYRGDTVVLTGTGFTPESIVMFGGYKVPDFMISNRSNSSISFIIPQYQLTCTEPEFETCPRLPIPGSGTTIETGGPKTVYVMNKTNKSTTTSMTFALPSKKITY